MAFAPVDTSAPEAMPRRIGIAVAIVLHAGRARRAAVPTRPSRRAVLAAAPVMVSYLVTPASAEHPTAAAEAAAGEARGEARAAASRRRRHRCWRSTRAVVDRAAETPAAKRVQPLPPIQESAPARRRRPRPAARRSRRPASTRPTSTTRRRRIPRSPAAPANRAACCCASWSTAAGRAETVDVRTSSGSPRLDNAALETVRRWRFVPARQGDHAVAAWVLVPINFTLEN